MQRRAGLRGVRPARGVGNQIKHSSSNQKVGAARIGQTQRRATLMDALCGAAVTYGFIRTIVYT